MSAVDRLHGARAYRNDNMCPGFVHRHRPDTRSPCGPWSLSRAASPARDLVQKGRRATCPVRPRRQSCSTDLLMHLHTPLHGGLPRQSRNRQVIDSELLCNPNCPATGEVGTVGNPAWRTATCELAGAANPTVSMTCISDGRSHAVRGTEVASCNSYQSGYYSAVCGHVVTPASMAAPDGEACRSCAEGYASHERRCRARRDRRWTPTVTATQARAPP